MKYVSPAIASKFFPRFLENLQDQSGKTFVITGTTSGTGRIAAHVLIQAGAQVIMLNRISDRARATQEVLSQVHDRISPRTIECDLTRFSSVREAAKQVRAICPSGIYALINNAGVMALSDEATEDGFDIQMQTNHLSHFLLTKELFPLLVRGSKQHGDSRVINHSSIARLAVRKLEPQYLDQNGGALGGNGSSMIFMGARWVRYSQTKLANASFTAALHHKLKKTELNIKSLLAHPGYANTELQVTANKHGGLAGLYGWLAQFFSQSAEDGALGLLKCATSPHAESGDFYGPGLGVTALRGPAERMKLEHKYNNPATRQLLWEMSCQAIGEEFTPQAV